MACVTNARHHIVFKGRWAQAVSFEVVDEMQGERLLATTEAVRLIPMRHSEARSGRRASGDFVPFPVDTTMALAALTRQFADSGKPVEVTFRKLVHWIRSGERSSHYLHPYPGKLLPHIAHFFLANGTYARPDDTVLDPFSGSGTVALETVLSGRTALYAEANPLGRLLTAVKTHPIDTAGVAVALEQVRGSFAKSRARKPPEVVNIQKWYSPAVIAQLVRLRAAIDALDAGHQRDLMLATFSAVARKSSNADPRFSVPVRYRPGDAPARPAPMELFVSHLSANCARLATLGLIDGLGEAIGVGNDARSLKAADGSRLADGSVGMIISSPPYAGAQKYVRASSLSLGWLGLTPASELRGLEERTIGREHFAKASWGKQHPSGIACADALIAEIAKENPSRATIVAVYLSEMRSALTEAVRVLRPGGHLVLVIGDNTVCGRRFASSEYLREMLEQLGMTVVLSLVDTILTRQLMTRRASTAGIIATESVIVFRKD